MRNLLPCLAIALVAGGCAGGGPGTEPTRTAAGETAPGDTGASAPAEAAPLPVTGALPGDRIVAFRTTVRRTEGSATREDPFDSHATAGTTLYIVNSAECPYCDGYAERMRQIETAYMAKGVEVVHVYPNRKEPTTEKLAWHGKQRFRGGLVLDADASIARGLEADRTPTVYVVDPRGVIVYRGAIDDRPMGGGGGTPFLVHALDAHLAGRPVAVKATEPYG